jgi:signal transduction histidine kinase
MQLLRLSRLTDSFRAIPLRAALIGPFVLQISVAVGLTAYVSLKDGQRAVNEVAAQLRNEVTHRIEQHLVSYLATPHLVTQLNTDDVRLGELNLRNSQGLERHLWQQMQQFDSLSPIAFANEQGEIHSVDRLRDGTLVIRAIDESTGGQYRSYTTDTQGNRLKLIRVDTTFDPRLRPWYQAAIRANQPTWTRIYPYFSSVGLAISATQPLYSDSGTRLGVTNATISLAHLSDFLHHLKVGRSGKTFIIERSGDLVASSTTEPLFLVNPIGTQRQRLSANASRNLVTRLTAQQVQSQFGSFNQIRQSQQLDFEIAGKRQFVQVMPFADLHGLDWVIVVVVPEADFMEHIEANRRTTVWLCLGALLLAIALGILTSRWITQPILRLCSASEDVASGKFDSTVSLGRIKELRVLAQAHNRMAIQLQASFTALEAVKAELELRVEQRTRQLHQALELEALVKRVTDKVRDSLDEAQVLQTMVEELKQVLATECCRAALYDLEQHQITTHYEAAQPGWSASQSQTLLLELESDLHLALLSGQSLQFCRFPPTSGRPQAATLACPIFDHEGFLGDLCLFRSPSAHFDEAEVRLVQQVANQCAIALRQAGLYRSVQTQVETLQQLHQLKDDFLSTVSHELRTPISNMKLAIHMLKLAPTPERQQQYLGILQVECEREASLINDLLDLQRLEAQHYSTSVSTIALQEWISSVTEPFLSRIQERNQSFNIDLPPDTQPVRSDRNSLSRLLAELLNNACKYTQPNGEIRLKIEQQWGVSRASEAESLVTKFVISNQVEIPPAALPHIFEKFYRVPNADPWKQGGTGLGLALVQKLVEQLEGEIQVESSRGWTTFRVVLQNLTE